MRAADDVRATLYDLVVYVHPTEPQRRFHWRFAAACLDVLGPVPGAWARPGWYLTVRIPYSLELDKKQPALLGITTVSIRFDTTSGVGCTRHGSGGSTFTTSSSVTSANGCSHGRVVRSGKGSRWPSRARARTFVELRRRFRDVRYWRGDGEVDFVVKVGAVPIPIQVTLDASQPRHERALTSFYESFSQAGEAILVTAESFPTLGAMLRARA